MPVPYVTLMLLGASPLRVESRGFPTDGRTIARHRPSLGDPEWVQNLRLESARKDSQKIRGTEAKKPLSETKLIRSSTRELANHKAASQRPSLPHIPNERSSTPPSDFAAEKMTYVIDAYGGARVPNSFPNQGFQFLDKSSFSEWSDWMAEQKKLHAPPADCVWGEWVDEGSCSVTCGGGSVQQRRSIDTEAQNGGKLCFGCEEQIIACNVDACPTSTTSQASGSIGSHAHSPAGPIATADSNRKGERLQTKEVHGESGDNDGWTDAVVADTNNERNAACHTVGRLFRLILGISLLVCSLHAY